MRKQSLYLNDIIKAIESAMSFTRGMSFNEFTSDDRTFSAVVRKLEIMGEAVKNVSDEIISSTPDIPWSSMARMRDKIIHGYFGIDADVIWKTVTKELPDILPVVKNLLEKFKD